MKKYRLCIIETVAHEATVEASSEMEARKEFRKLVEKGNFNWDNGEYVDFEITSIENWEGIEK